FSVFLSSIVALTLCPMLASRFLKQGEYSEKRSGPLARFGGVAANFYKRTLNACLNAPLVAVLAAVIFAAVAFATFAGVKNELTPSEDRSMAMMRITAPQGVSLDYLAGKLQQIEASFKPLIDSGELETTFSVIGQGGTNSAFLVLGLAPWNERDRSQQEILNEVNQLASQVAGVRAFAFQPNSLNIPGSGSGLQFAVAGRRRARPTGAPPAITADQ